MKVPWTRPSIGEIEKRAVTAVMESGWLTQGKEVRNFEREICEYIGCKHAVCVSSGTAGLFLAAFFLKKYQLHLRSIAVSASTFAASVHPFLALSKNIIPVDVSERYLVVDSTDHIKRMLDFQFCDAAVMTHLCGNAAKYGGLFSRSSMVIEDGCQAFGSEVIDDGKVGSISTICVFSFHMAKVLTTVEGGCIVTHDDGIAGKMREMRNNGLKNGYEFEGPAMNARMTDIQAMIGRAQLGKLEKGITHRERIADVYFEELGAFEDEHLIGLSPAAPWMKRRVWSMFPVAVNDAENFVEFLTGMNIEVRRFFPPVSYPSLVPNAKLLRDKNVFLPIGNAITMDEIVYVCNCVKKYFEKEKREKNEDG